MMKTKRKLSLFLVLLFFSISVCAQTHITPNQGVELLKQKKIMLVLDPIRQCDAELNNGDLVYSDFYEPDAKNIAFDPTTNHLGLIPLTGPRTGQVISWSTALLKSESIGVARFYAYSGSSGFEVILKALDDNYLVLFWYNDDMIVGYLCK